MKYLKEIKDIVRNEKLRSKLVCKGYKNIKLLSWKRYWDNLKSLHDKSDRGIAYEAK